MSKHYYIQTSRGVIAGFHTRHQIVQWTNTEYAAQYGKKFKTAAAATKWASKYAGQGYGLQQGSFSIVEL